MVLARIGATWLLSRGDASVPASRPHRPRPYAGMGPGKEMGATQASPPLVRTAPAPTRVWGRLRPYPHAGMGTQVFLPPRG